MDSDQELSAILTRSPRGAQLELMKTASAETLRRLQGNNEASPELKEATLAELELRRDLQSA